MNNTFGQKNVPRCPNKTSLATLTLGARSTLRLRILILIVIHVLDIASPWIVFEFRICRAWGPDMWMMFAVATAACLYYSGGLRVGWNHDQNAKSHGHPLCVLLRCQREPAVSSYTRALDSTDGRLCLLGWKPLEPLWLDRILLVDLRFASHSRPSCLSQVTASYSCECKSQKSLAPRKKAEF